MVNTDRNIWIPDGNSIIIQYKDWAIIGHKGFRSFYHLVEHPAHDGSTQHIGNSEYKCMMCFLEMSKEVCDHLLKSYKLMYG